MIPNNEDSSTSEKSTSSRLPDNTFVTYSSDSTIRFWNLDQNSNSSSSNANSHNRNSSSTSNSNVIKKNIYSKECLKIVYVDPNGTYQMCATLGAKNDDSESSSSTDNHQPVISDGGVRTLRISPDGKLMASGDRNGNLRVHNLDDFQQMTYQEAHDAEILAIEFTDGKLPESPYLIATASRDRILHIFDINSNFQLIQTLDDHSSSITAIKFTNDGGRLISCGADKSIILTALVLNLPQDLLEQRKVIIIDVANDTIDQKDYKEDEDPTLYHSRKTGRGPLKGDWINKVTPVMTCYKLVTVEFKWRGIQSKIEAFIHSTMQSLFTRFHRQLFCWTDKWFGLSLDDIRKLEDKTKQELDESIKAPITNQSQSD
ncbi:11010_t:CDS:2 [Entrophospora sp. SA101]|nr:11010_t:CDS:2 [Entrophospora sp. SA101]